MEFEWDEEKERKNIKKHGISFIRAATIFTGPLLTSEDKRKNYGETRMQTIGTMEGEVVVLVVHTNRRNVIRIISARIANKKERGKYYGYVKEN